MKRFDDEELEALRREATYSEPYTPRFSPDYILVLIRQLREAQETIERVKNVMSTNEVRMETMYGAEVWAVHTGDLMEALGMSVEEIEERKIQVEVDTID